MMRFYVIAFILIIVSCTNNNDLQSEVESITGRIVPFECKDLHCCNYDNQLVIQKLLSSPKILSYIDEFPCTTCGINMLKNWSSYIDSLCSGTPYIIICRIEKEDRDDFISRIKKERFKSYIFVTSSKYYMTNLFSIVRPMNRTIMVNKENKVILVGEPFNNSSLSNLYKEVSKRNHSSCLQNNDNLGLR